MTSLGKVWSKLRFLAGRGWARHLFAAAEGRGEIKLNYPACVAQAYPLEFPAAQRSTETVLQATKGVDTSLLARHSPGLRDFDWPAYLNCSLVRVAQTAAAIRRHCGPTVRVLDFGSYFGNFTLALRELGHRVDAIDSYRTYEPALATVVAELQASGAQVYDFASVGYGLETIPSDSYDAVLAMGVLEHVPHTPRLLLETLNRVLKPGGILVMDTPNLAYAYRRQQLARGETIFCPIALQYFTEVPFEGHHREYTMDEVRWMVQQLQHTDIVVDTYDYSIYMHKTLRGRARKNYLLGQVDPSFREVILSISRKPARLASAA